MINDSATILGVLYFAAQIVGIVTAIHAVMEARTSQGAIAWALSLIMFSPVAVPLYWVFGRSKFQGYIRARRVGDSEISHVLLEAAQRAEAEGLDQRDLPDDRRVFAQLAKMPFLKFNQVELLIDGAVICEAILAAIDSAEDYILVQSYIVRDDRIGREFQKRLLQKASEDVRVYFLYDEIGSYSLSRRYLQEMREGGVQIQPFRTTKGVRNRFQLNFRNHRKLVVVDGRAAFVGGLNIGDEYLGLDPAIGVWRDTHVRIKGPAVHVAQLSFLEDWHWATHEIPRLDWQPRAAQGGAQDVLVLATGPDDDLETCDLFFVQAINAARKRLWIASPYFVPDPPVMVALQLAALRGVDVRIVLPENPDHLLVYLSAFSFLDEAEQAGVKIYRYLPGFMHHKVLLIDHDLAAVGTANLDNRSFRLNFEITVIVADQGFAAEVQRMFEDDFSRCRIAKSEDHPENRRIISAVNCSPGCKTRSPASTPRA
jgi:cardiolipin synthase A/B